MIENLIVIILVGLVGVIFIFSVLYSDIAHEKKVMRFFLKDMKEIVYPIELFLYFSDDELQKIINNNFIYKDIRKRINNYYYYHYSTTNYIDPERRRTLTCIIVDIGLLADILEYKKNKEV